MSLDHPSDRAVSRNRQLEGSPRPDLLIGGRGDDTLRGGAGSDLLYGGAGDDVALYDGSVRDYAVNQLGNSLVASVRSTGDVTDPGLDLLVGVEALHFAGDDYTLYLDGRNNAALAGDDAAAGGENQVIDLAVADLLANDTEYDGDSLSITGVAPVSTLGAMVSLTDGVLRYDPGSRFDALAEGETVTDSFTYTVDDGKGGTDTATVTVTITGSNDAPVLTVADATVAENQTTVTTAAAVDVDGPAPAFSLGGEDAALFTIDADTGEITFRAAADFEQPADADGDNLYRLTVVATDDLGAATEQDITVAVTDVAEVPASSARINELHYDNAGADADEFVEVRVAAGDDVAALSLALYNGSNGTVYGTFDVAGGSKTSDGTWDYYVIETPGLQNGSPDGLALVSGAQVLEFLSYEGSFTATDGPAAGQASEDIGVSEGSATEAGLSLARNEDGSWSAPAPATAGAGNSAVPLISELAISTAGTDWEFVELSGAAGASLDGYALIQIDGDGEVRSVIDFTGGVFGENGFYLAASAQAESTFGLGGDQSFVNNTFTNTSSTFLLVEGFTGAAQFTDLDPDDDGTLDGTPWTSILDSVAVIDDDGALTYSPNVVGPDGTNLGAGAVRAGDVFQMTSFAASDTYTPTPGGGGSVDPVPQLISAIQGSGEESALVGQAVQVSAIVTAITDTGFYLQEEDADSDGNASTSEGIFVFTGSMAGLAVGDLVSVVGTVEEFFGLTEIGSVTEMTVQGSGNVLPTAGSIALSPDTLAEYEALEGMRVTLASGTSDRLTVIENFNFDRFGEIVISAGTQVTPTQIYDAQTEAGAITALMQANSNSRITLDDGVSSQNPDGFAYVPVPASADNGNGYLDAGDDFSNGGATLRLGAELSSPVEGVLTFGFDEWRIVPTAQIDIDETTNSGARPTAPADVGGSLQVASVNVLNYFSTLGDSGGTSGPSGLEPRGADNAAEFARQTEKLVATIGGTGAEVLALQEIENNGFGEGSAIATLVEELNADAAATGSGASYAFVDPTGSAGFVGSDAIMAALVYDASRLTLVASDILTYTESTSAATQAVADVLNAVVPPFAMLENLDRNRPSVAATFLDNATGESFTVVSSHFKSKGDSGLAGLADAAQAYLNAGGTAIAQADVDALRADPNFDQGDGQGFWNGVRLEAASELSDWMENGYLGTGTSDYLLLGDMNAYSEEDPVQYLRDEAGLTDVVQQFIGSDAFSYTFDGMRGTLDQGLVSDGLADAVTGATEWHVNSDEPDLIGYDLSFKDAGFYNPGPYASSDHDPLVIGLDLDPGLFV